MDLRREQLSCELLPPLLTVNPTLNRIASMPSGSIRFSYAEVIWKAPGADRFLALIPAKFFDPTQNRGKGKWASGVTLQDLTSQTNARREVFFLHDHAWHYYGEYECVGSTAMSAKEVEEIGSAQVNDENSYHVR